ncbi:PDR/VanB family oxidoreductase [Bradyrhizobium japonicum]|uniref:PDR/VanB family oxidoreductase n=1 Tax=Bradyrhizobium japonicum TaxID=375 RepID=UPI001BADC8B2|nr:PDR/VanB family oxidoreductase [Bradyrhizobium japonicum]MBR0911553.1 oxidoreductase [Bradyrhizobium japonicum]
MDDNSTKSDGTTAREAALLDVTVSRRSRETADIALVELVAAGSGKLPSFTAGSHVDFHLPNGVMRQYSICSDPADTGIYRFGVLLTSRSRGGSRAVHALKVGESIKIGVPRNQFALDEGARKTILVGGGIGITPLLSMAYRLHALGASFELIYCARDRLKAAFQKRLSNSAFSQNIRWRFDKVDGRTGFNPSELPSPDGATHLYVCGPSAFTNYVVQSAIQAGWSKSNVHTENFQPYAPNKDDREFTVVAQRGGKAVTVRSGQTIAQALKEAGIAVTVSCEQGICGTCLVPVLEGVPEHRDRYQSDLELSSNRFVALCCSRSKNDTLVLDI